MKTPNPIDTHVGSRVRMRRMMLGMSQEKLGEAFGLTFQQVQKYEKGMNRMGSSRLQQAADILGVAVPFFFEGGPGGSRKMHGNAPVHGSGTRPTAGFPIERDVDEVKSLRELEQLAGKMRRRAEPRRGEAVLSGASE